MIKARPQNPSLPKSLIVVYFDLIIKIESSLLRVKGWGGFAAQPGSLVVDPASRARWDRPEKLQAERKGKRKRKRKEEREREARGSQSEREPRLPHCTNKL